MSGRTPRPRPVKPADGGAAKAPKRLGGAWGQKGRWRRRTELTLEWHGPYTVTTVDGSGARSHVTERTPSGLRLSRFSGMVGVTPDMRRSMDAFYGEIDRRLRVAELQALRRGSAPAGREAR